MNIRLSIEYDRNQIPVAARTVCYLCSLTGSDYSRAKNMELAIVELLNNIINYGKSQQSGTLIDLHCKFDDGDFVVTVSHRGQALEPNVASAYTNETIEMPGVGVDIEVGIPDLPECGWGIQLIKSACDEVDYRRVGEKNVYQLSFSLLSVAA